MSIHLDFPGSNDISPALRMVSVHDDLLLYPFPPTSFCTTVFLHCCGFNSHATSYSSAKQCTRAVIVQVKTLSLFAANNLLMYYKCNSREKSGFLYGSYVKGCYFS
jgi:hypothetical protein